MSLEKGFQKMIKLIIESEIEQVALENWIVPTLPKANNRKKKPTKTYYFNAQEEIYAKLAQLPRGTIKERVIAGRTYYYLQHREGKKVVHAYIGKEIPRDLKDKMRERENLRAELKKIRKIVRKLVSAELRNIL